MNKIETKRFTLYEVKSKMNETIQTTIKDNRLNIYGFEKFSNFDFSKINNKNRNNQVIKVKFIYENGNYKFESDITNQITKLQSNKIDIENLLNQNNERIELSDSNPKEIKLNIITEILENNNASILYLCLK